MTEATNTNTLNRIAAGNAPSVSQGALDGELLKACASFHAIDERRAAVDRAGNVSDQVGRAMDEEWDSALNEVSALKPKTPEGVRARAGVAFVALRGVVAHAGTTWQNEANKFEFLALDALADSAGIAVA